MSRARRSTPFAGAIDIDARIGGQRLRLEIVERRAHDGHGRAQLVRKAPRHRLEIGVVVLEAREHGGRRAREVADLVLRIGGRDGAAHASLRVDRGIGLGVQAAYARGEPRGECEQDHERRGHHGERQREQVLERAFLEDLDRAPWSPRPRRRPRCRRPRRSVAPTRGSPRRDRACRATAVEDTPISARSTWLRTGCVSSPAAGTGGVGTTRAASGAIQLVNGGALRRLAQRPRKAAHARVRIDHPHARRAPPHDREQALDLVGRARRRCRGSPRRWDRTKRRARRCAGALRPCRSRPRSP